MGTENPGDLGANSVEADQIIKYMDILNMQFPKGRSDKAQNLHVLRVPDAIHKKSIFKNRRRKAFQSLSRR